MQFHLRVIRDSGLPTQLELDAASAIDAKTQAEKQGYTVLQTKQKNSWALLRKSRFPLLLFSQELQVLIEAGLTLPEALETLMEKEHQPETRTVMAKLLAAIQEGQQLSSAMATLPLAFPELFVATIRAAETTGDTPEALNRYTLYLEQVDILKKRITSAAVYPALVLGFGVLVVIFLMAYVVPRFSKVYQSNTGELSFTTDLLLKAGNFSQEYGLITLVAMFGLAVLAFNLIRQPNVKAKILDWFWKLPYLGEKIKIYHLSRLYRTFSMLLKSGIPVVSGLSMVNRLLGTSLESNLLKAKRLISEGHPLSKAFADSDLVSPVSLRLFRVGERTGKLETMMERAASFHEDQLTRWVDTLTKTVEPLLITVIGVVIGGIVLMMYLPIFELASGLD